MSNFSIGDAVGSGFGLIAKRPVAVVIWGLAYVAIVALPMGLIFGFLLGDLPALIANVKSAAPGDGPPPAVFALQSKLMLLNPLMIVTSLAGRALLAGAVFRGVLEPENRKFLSLRFGRQELWLALVFLAYGFVIGFAIFGIIVAGALVGGLGWIAGGFAPSNLSGLVRGLFIAVAVIGAIVASFWVALRLSLAPAITFAEKEFRLFESWNLTKGHVWKLFGVGLVLYVIAAFIGSVFYGLFFGGMISMMGGFSADHIRDFVEHLHQSSPQQLLQALAPTCAVVVVLVLLLVGPVSAVLLAPWAYAYRELSKGAKPQHPLVF